MLCGKCVGRLTSNLQRIPGLWHDLQDTITGQTKMTAGGKSNERAMPYREKPSKASTYVKNQLATWVIELDMGDTEGLGDNVRALALWLKDRVQRIRAHAAAEEACDEFAYCVQIMTRYVDRPADLDFCGTCEVCGKDRYSRHGAVEGVCRGCKAAGIETIYDPVGSRGALLARARDEHQTVAKCAMVLASFGLPVKAKTIQNWAAPRYRIDSDGVRHATHPPRIWATGTDDSGANLYRIGDVEDLIREALEAKVGKVRVA